MALHLLLDETLTISTSNELMRHSMPKDNFNKSKETTPTTSAALMVKFMFSKKATKIDEIFTVDLTLFIVCQINSEDFVNFCGLLRKHEL